VNLASRPPKISPEAVHRTGSELAAEWVRSAHNRRMIERLLHDIRFSARQLLVQRGYSFAIVMTLALALGANLTVFGVIEGRLLRALPYPDSERLVYIHNTYRMLGVVDSGNTVPDYLDRREHASALQDSAIYYDYSFDLVEQDAPQRLAGSVASSSLFSTLGVGAALGRVFTEAEDSLGNQFVVLLSDALWRNQFAADPLIVGRDIHLNGQPYRVLGVMPSTFAFPRREIALWVPFAWTDRQGSDAMRGFEFAQSIGRLKPRASIEQLNAQFDAIVANNVARFGRASELPGFAERVQRGGFTSRAQSLHAQLSGDITQVLVMLQAAVALLLAIALANVANLMLIRLSQRRRELSMRRALGASPRRIAGQLLTESALLALAGGGVGLGLAAAGWGWVRHLGLDGAEQGFSVGIGPSLLGVALFGVLLSALLAVLPVIAALRRSGFSGLAESGRGAVSSRVEKRQRGVLVVLQISLAVALLSGAGLLGHSLWRLQQVDPGFTVDDVVTVSINLSRAKYPDVEDRRRFNVQIMQAVRAMPGVLSAGVVSQLPFSADYGSSPYFVEGDPRGSAASELGEILTADHDYFRSMQMPLLRGRAFETTDDANGLPVAIIDQALARRSFRDGDALGQRIGTANVDGTINWRTVVGVVPSIKTQNLAEAADAPSYYFPLAQQPASIFRIVIKTQQSAAAVAEALRLRVAGLDPEQPLWDVMSMRERLHDSLTAKRTPAGLLMLFASIALLLSAIGVYAVLAHSVGQQTAEIGVRMSLGASRHVIARWVLAAGARWILAGLLIGSLLATLLAYRLRELLFEVSPLDLPTMAGVLLVISPIALLACWLPARRAAQISPMAALRHS